VKKKIKNKLNLKEEIEAEEIELKKKKEKKFEKKRKENQERLKAEKLFRILNLAELEIEMKW